MAPARDARGRFIAGSGGGGSSGGSSGGGGKGGNVGTARVSIRPELAEGWQDNVRKGLEGGLSGLETVGRAAGGALMAGLTAVVGGGTALANLGGEFDQVFDTIRVGTGATGEVLAGLQDSFRNVASTVPEDFGAVGQAVADLNTRLGLTGQPLEDLSRQMLDLSRITGTDLNANLVAVPRLLNDWSIPADAASGSLDALFRNSQATGIGFDRLSTLMVNFGAPMRQLGFGFNETAALLGSFEKAGVRTELVMGAMRIGLGKLAAAGETDIPRAFRETITSIQNAGSASEATTIAIELFGSKAGPDMAAAIREGRFSVDDLIGAMETGTDTISGLADETADWPEKLKISFNEMKLAVEPAASAVFGALGGAIDQVAPVMVESVARLAPVISEAVTTLVPVVTGALSELTTVFATIAAPLVDAFAAAAPLIVETLSGLVSLAMTTLGPVIEAFGAVLPGLIEDLAPVLKAVFDALTPVAKVLGEVMARAITDLAPLVGDLAQVFGRLVSVFGPAFADALNGVTGTLLTLATTILPPLIQGLDWLVSAVEPVAPALTGVALAFLAFKRLEGLNTTITGFGNAVATTVGKVQQQFGTFNTSHMSAEAAFNTSTSKMNDHVAKIGSKIGDVAQAAGPAFAIITTALGVAEGIMKDQAEGMTQDLQRIDDSFANITSIDDFRTKIEEVEGYIPGLRDQMPTIFDRFIPNSEIAAEKMEGLAGWQTTVADRAEELKRVWGDALSDREALNLAEQSLGEVAQGAKTAEDAIRRVQDAMEALKRFQEGSLNAAIGYNQALDDLATAIAENGGLTLNIDEEEGRRQTEYMRTAVGNAREMAIAMAQSGKSAEEAQAAFDQSLQRIADAAGMPLDQLKEILNYTGILDSTQVNMAITAETEKAEIRLGEVKAAMLNLSEEAQIDIKASLDAGNLVEAEAKLADWQLKDRIIDFSVQPITDAATAQMGSWLRGWAETNIDIPVDADTETARQMIEDKLLNVAWEAGIDITAPEAENVRQLIVDIANGKYPAQVDVDSNAPDVSADIDEAAKNRESDLAVDLDAGDAENEYDDVAEDRNSRLTIDADTRPAQRAWDALQRAVRDAVLSAVVRIVTPSADGNLFGGAENHVAQISPAVTRVWAEPETGGEAYIPLAPSKRQRSLDIWARTGRLLGVPGFADGAVVGGLKASGGDGVTFTLNADVRPAQSAIQLMIDTAILAAERGGDEVGILVNRSADAMVDATDAASTTAGTMVRMLDDDIIRSNDNIRELVDQIEEAQGAMLDTAGEAEDAWATVGALVDELRAKGLTDEEISWLSQLEEGAVRSQEEFQRLVDALAGPGGIRSAEQVLLGLGRTQKETAESAGELTAAGGEAGTTLGTAGAAGEALGATLTEVTGRAADAAWQLTQAATGASYLEDHARRAEPEVRRLAAALVEMRAAQAEAMSGGGSSTPTTSGVGQWSITVNNPKPEPASSSVSREMRKLASAGLFG